MKPKLLKIIGLNSFIEEQVIDFSKLTENGLFGIFGPTGSGKSTILDAMTLALYGQVARKSTMYINTETDKLYIYFEFESGHGSKRKIYIIERSLKKANTNGIKTVSAKLIRRKLEGEIESVIEGRNTIEKEIQDNIIGLNFEDFIRTVVLPQGKFSEFLTLTGAERNKMLERILGLEDYGDKLNTKVKLKRDMINNELNRLIGELNRYEGVNEELLVKLQMEYKALIEREKEFAKKETMLESNYEKSKKIWELQKELNDYLKKEVKLKEIEKNVEDKKVQLSKGKNALNVIPYVNSIKKTQSDIKENKSILVNYQVKIECLVENIKKIEKNYTIALERKEKELPLLFEKKSKLDNVIELIKEKEALEQERNILTDKYKNYELKLKSDNDKLQEVIKKRILIENEVNAKEELIKHITVSPEYRKKVIEASDLEKRYRTFIKDKQEYDDKIIKLESNIKEIKIKLDQLKDKKAKKDIELDNINTVMKELEKNKPEDSKEISSLQLKIYELSNKIKEYYDTEVKLATLNDEKNKLYSQFQKINSYLNEYREELQKKSSLQKVILKDIKEIEYQNIANVLSIQLLDGEPCPVCGSIHHPNIVQKYEDIQLESKKSELNKIEEEIIEIQKQVNDLESDQKILLSETKRLDEDIQANIKNIDNIKVEELVREKDSIEHKINTSQEYIEKWNKAYRDTYDDIIRCREEKNQLINKEIECLTNIKKDEEQLSDLYNKASQLSKEIKTVSTDYESVRKELNLEDISEELTALSKADKEIEELNIKLKQLRDDNKKYELEKNNLEQIINKYSEEMKVIVNSGKEKREVIDKYQNSIEKVAGKDNPIELKNETERLIKEITDNELLHRNSLEKERKDLNKLQEEKTAIERTIKILEESETDTQSKLNKALIENDFKDIDEVLVYYQDKQNLDMLELEVKKYNDEINNLASNITRVKEELRNDSLSEDEWNKLNLEREETKSIHSELLKDVGQKKEQLNEVQNNLEEVKRLISGIKELEHKKDLLTDILELTKAKRFVEFVSRSHLRYIARVATVKLREITRERYGLEIDSNNNFMIVDNYNGGIKRECNSLSGGETFLTSLSLALALSSKIQLKGNTSIEFFFLDEGFGTLDNSLLDIVMTSLERLYKEELSVGIISHVDELKNRVPVKLIVSPPVSGVRGTTVRIEYS